MSAQNQRGDTRHTNSYRHRTRPNLEDNVGGDENHHELRRNTPGSEMTTPKSPRTLTKNTAPTSYDSIGSLKETVSSIVHVREIKQTEIAISSMLRSTITTNPTHTSITSEGTQLQQPNYLISTAGEWNDSRHSATTPSKIIATKKDKPPDSSAKKNANHQKQSWLHSVERNTVYKNR